MYTEKILVGAAIVFLTASFCMFSFGARATDSDAKEKRARARDLGIIVGILPTGLNNAITDVPGVKVGHCTVVEKDDIRTGITAILPHSGNLFQDKVPGAVHVGNGFGKLIGTTQIEELGEIETPILLTGTLNVPKVAEGLIEYMLTLPGNEKVKSINPIVGETNDGWLSNIRKRPLGFREVKTAIEDASSGPVAEGSIGAGTGTVCFGFKGGIGTSSRILPPDIGGYTVGVLVQSNFGGILQINGAPVGRELKQFHDPTRTSRKMDGSCMIVVATDAPLLDRNLERFARRAILGLARTGSFLPNGSGDYVIAFSTAEFLRSSFGKKQIERPLGNDDMSSLFLAVVEATEEAIYNSLLKATSVTGMDGHHAEAIPLDRVKEICEEYKVLHWDKNLPSKE